MEDQHTTMEESEQHPAPPDTLQITDPVRSAWREIAGWFTFWGIVLAIICLISLILMYDVLPDAVAYQRYGTIILFYSFVLGLVVVVFYLLAAWQIRLGLEREEAEPLEKSFTNLNRLYKFSNILSGIMYTGMLVVVLMAISTVVSSYTRRFAPSMDDVEMYEAPPTYDR